MCNLQNWNIVTWKGNRNPAKSQHDGDFQKSASRLCDNCGEYYLSEEITDKLLNRAESVVKNSAEVEILRFAA